MRDKEDPNKGDMLVPPVCLSNPGNRRNRKTVVLISMETSLLSGSKVVLLGVVHHHMNTILISAGLTVNTPLVFAKYATRASKDPPRTLIYCVSVCQHSTIVMLLCVPCGDAGIDDPSTHACTSLTSDDTLLLVARAALGGVRIVIGSTSDKPKVKSVYVCVLWL